MYYLALLFPGLKGKRLLPLSRDQLMLLMAAINLLFLSFDIYLAHNLNGTIRPREWIPIIFGAVAGVLLLLAGLIALRRLWLRPSVNSSNRIGMLQTSSRMRLISRRARRQLTHQDSPS